jgi:hypothetical protein
MVKRNNVRTARSARNLADRALAVAATITKARKPRARRAKTRRNITTMQVSTLPRPMRLSDVDRYIRSLYTHELIEGLQLPASHTRAYSHVACNCTYVPITGTTNATTTIFNMYAMPIAQTFVNYEYNNGGVAFTGSVPSIMSSDTASVSGWPESTAANTFELIQMNSTVGVNASNYMIRPHGVEVDIEYTGTELNMGGLLTVFHGGAQCSLLTQGSAAAGGFDWSLNTGELLTDPTKYTRVRIGSRARFVLRPVDPQFKLFRSVYRNEIEAGVLGLRVDNSQIACEGVLPYYDGGNGHNQLTPYGWTTGFRIEPAAGAAGGAAQYVVTLRWVGDISQYGISANIQPSAGGMPVTTPITHPLAEAKLANHLANHHAANVRGDLRQVVTAAAEGAGQTIAKRAAGALETLGARFAAAAAA